MGKGSEHSFLQSTHKNVQQAQEKILNTTSYQGNTTPTQRETLPHSHQAGHNKNRDDNKCWQDVGKLELSYSAGIKYRPFGKQSGSFGESKMWSYHMTHKLHLQVEGNQNHRLTPKLIHECAQQHLFIIAQNINKSNAHSLMDEQNVTDPCIWLSFSHAEE